MLHFTWRLSFFSSCQECRIQRNIPDVAAGHVELRKAFVIQTACRRVGREHPAPDRFAVYRLRKWEAHEKSDPALERTINRRLQVGREDGQPLVSFHSLQKISD